MNDRPAAQGHALIGRHAELRAIRRFLETRLGDRGLGGRPGALLIQGPAGIGKTALWLSALEQAEASGFRVLVARPVEAEATFAYAALADLLRDVVPAVLPRLPGQQRRTLEVALGMSDDRGARADPQLVQSAVTSAMLLLTAEAPLVIGIDDAPWLDAPTAGALQFFARRVGSRAVGFVVAQRVEEQAAAPIGLDTAFPGGSVERLWLEPMSVAALHELLDERLGMTLPRPHLIRLHKLSGGVPFHALEIARALQRGPLPPIGAPLPIPASLRDLLAARAARLIPAARETLLLVAAAGTLSTRAIATVLGAEPAREGITAAVDEGLVAVEGESLRASHPLVASTVYSAAAPGERRDAHERLARVTDEPEARARHRALARPGADEDVAAELEAAGTRATERGAPETASELLRLARERTPQPHGRAYARRSLALAEALAAADDLSAAREVVDELILQLQPGRTLAQARMLRAEIAWYTEASSNAVAHLEAGLAAATGHADIEAGLRYRLAIFSDFDEPRALEHARVAVDLLAGLDRPAALSAALMQQFYSEVRVGLPPRPEILERALSIEPPDSQERTTIPGIWWTALDRTDDARRRFEMMLESDRVRGDLSNEADLLTRLAEVELYADRYASARQYADAATAAARQHGDESADPARRVRALVDAHQGLLSEARSVAEPAAARAAAAGDPIIATAWLVVLAFVAASREDYAEVDRIGTASAEQLAAMKVVEPLRLGVEHERLEALVALSRLDVAERVLAELEQRHERIPRPWLEAAVVRGRALLLLARGDAGRAASVTEALFAPSVGRWRSLDRARTLTVRGTILRRLRARREAADALDEAVRVFTELGATAWAARARSESERLGRRRLTSDELTPTEAQVAELAAAGLTNREAAERLSVSPKTIEAHLARVYPKLGIRSRAELGRLMATRHTKT